MQTFNIHEAKTNLSKLIENAVKGESFIIAKAGKPLVKVTRIDAPDAGSVKRTGFMAGPRRFYRRPTRTTQVSLRERLF
jgi:prevent-host-death family protein